MYFWQTLLLWIIGIAVTLGFWGTVLYFGVKIAKTAWGA